MRADQVIPFIERWTGESVAPMVELKRPSSMDEAALRQASQDPQPTKSQRLVSHTGWSPLA